MATKLVTGKSGTLHVTSADDGALYAALFGSGRFSLGTGSDFALTIETANRVTVGTGSALMDGRFFRTTSSETLIVESGSQGKNRNDIVGYLYRCDQSTGIETGEWSVVKGEPSDGAASDPALPQGSIIDGASEAFMPFYRLPLTGISLGAPVKLFSSLPSTAGCPWPVGAVLQLATEANPNDMYAGTSWEKMEGVFLLSSSGGHPLGTKGGKEEHTLTVDELPSHTHVVNGGGGAAVTGGAHSHGVATTMNGTAHGSSVNALQFASYTSTFKYVGAGETTSHSHSLPAHAHSVSNAGGGKAHDNMPPYEVVNTWKRVA